MKMGEQFWADGHGDRETLKAALIIGRQWSGTTEEPPVYVLNEDVLASNFRLVIYDTIALVFITMHQLVPEEP